MLSASMMCYDDKKSFGLILNTLIVVCALSSVISILISYIANTMS